MQFVFHHEWLVPVGPGAAWAALADVEHYPGWWPQVRAVRRMDADTGEVRIRSALPWTLRLTVAQEVADPDTGRLRVTVDGDLRGWCQWQVTADGSGSRATFDQQVELTRPYAARLAPLARPLLVANHAWMMRAGERGLRTFLR